MIRRLRLKFVCTVMAIVTLLLCAIFALVYGFTSRNLERESLGMMQAVAQNPQHPDGPGEAPEGVRLPYFILELDEDGGIVSASGGYYDLTDGELLETFTALSEGRNTGVLEDYGLRYVSVGDGNVYLVSSDLLTNFSCGLYDLVSMEAMPDMSDLVSITVERPSGTLVIDCLEDGGYGLTDRYMYFAEDGGEYTALSNELAYSFIYQVTGLSWGSCVDYKAEPKTLGDYGLDTPSV